MAACSAGLCIQQALQAEQWDQLLQENAMEPAALLGRSYLELLQSEVAESVLYMQVEEATEISAGQSADTLGDLDVFYTVEGEEVCQCSNTGEAYDKIAALAEYLLEDQQEQPVEEIFGSLVSEETVTECTGGCTEGKRRPSSCSDGPEAKRRKVIAHAPALCIMDGDSVRIVPNNVASQCDVRVEFSVATVGCLGRSLKAFAPSASPITDLYLSGMKGIQVILTVQPLAPLTPSPAAGPGDPWEKSQPGEVAPHKGPPSPPVPSEQAPRRPESADAFQAQLKSHFRDTCEFVPLEHEIPLDRLYIDSDLVQCHLESKSGRNADPRACDLQEKTVVPRSQLFHTRGKNDGGTKVIVILGKAGMGKSLLVQKICLDWSNDRLPGFDFVFRFDCRKINFPVEDQDSLKRLLFEESVGPREDAEEIFRYLLQNPRRVLLIFDGFEELENQDGFPALASNSPPRRKLCGTGATLAGLFQKKVLNGCTLLLTSRPKNRLHLYLPRMDTILEVVGFSAQQAERYLAEYFHGCPFADEAVNSVRNSPCLFSHCYHPSLCQFICESVFKLGSRDLPFTLTGLLVKSLLRKLDLATETGSPSNYPNLNALARMAWQLGESQQKVFPGHHFPSEKVRDFALDSGLVVRLPQDCNGRKGECEYSFPTFVVQHFLLALHLVLAREMKDKRLTKHLCLLCKSKKFLSAWGLVPRFLSGFLFLEDDLRSSFLFGEGGGEPDAEKMVSKKQKSLLKYIRKLSIKDFGPDKLVELLHCVHETGDRYLWQHVALELQPDLSFQGFPLNPSDVYVLHSVLRRSSKAFSLDLRGSALDPGGLRRLVMEEKVSTFRASLGDTVQLWKDLWESEAEEQLQAAVKKFGVVPFKAETMKDVEDLCRLVRLQEDMTRGCVPPRDPVWGSMDPRSCLQSCEMLLSFCTAGIPYSKTDVTADGKNSYIPAVTNLQHLEFILDSPNENEIGDEGVALLSKVLPRLTLLETLNLSRNKITDVGAQTLAQALPLLSLLKVLSLYNNNIGDAGAEHLAKRLPRMSSLRVLDIQCNKITAGGAQHFTESIRRCPHIQRVRLWNPAIPHGVLDHLQQLDSRIRLL
uniref:MHC class II transactivator isoform X3 n=1 Tax=Pogona vitticeps TaxID=103695 RepID=A0ABM5EZZ1_9SAUR